MSDNIATYTLESAACVLILAVAYKIHRMRCNSSSDCCGDAVHVDTHNPGVNPENNV